MSQDNNFFFGRVSLFVKLVISAALVSFLSFTTARAAQVVYDNGNNVQTGTIANAAIQSLSPSHAADDFTVATDSVVTEIKWKGYFTGAGHAGRLDDNFEIRIYSDNAGLPAALPPGANYEAVLGNVSRLLTGELAFGVNEVFEFSSTIPTFTANTGKKYWIELYDNIDTSQWLWSCSTVVDGGNGVTDYTGVWEHHVQRIEFTFQLFGAPVPEPSTFALLATGAVGVCLYRKRRQR